MGEIQQLTGEERERWREGGEGTGGGEMSKENRSDVLWKGGGGDKQRGGNERPRVG